MTDKHPLRILLLEDDPCDAQLMQDLLEESFFLCEVTRVQTRDEFVSALKTKNVDLILADYHLPSFDGLSALRLLLEEGSDLPFIFVSGTLGEEVAIEALKIGATDYVLKTGLSRLVPAVRRALREAEEKTERNKAEQAMHRAEEAARQSDSELHGLIENIPAMVFIALPGPCNTFASRQWRQYTGLSEEDTTGAGWRKVIHQEDLERHLEEWRSCAISGSAFEHEVRLRRAADGECRWFLVRAVPIRDGAGGILKWFGVATDIEDRRRAEDASRAAQAELAHINRIATMGQLTASIAHEVSQPVAATLTYAQAAMRWLRADPPALAEAQDALNQIIESGKRASAVIARIRALIKKAPLQNDNVGVNETVSEVIALTRSEALKNSVGVQTDLMEGLPFVKGDRVQLQQVVLNLILNAFEAMSSMDGGARELKISTGETSADGVLVTVRDTGPGLDQGNLERVFEPFYTTKSQGMGIGLAICRSIIEAHGGRLWATTGEPHGGVFHFTLPSRPDSSEHAKRTGQLTMAGYKPSQPHSVRTSLEL